MKPYPYANARTLTAAFAAESTNSGTVDISRAAPRGIAVEGTSVGDWTAADIAFQVSADSETWYDVRDSEGARVTVPVGASVYAAPAEAWFVGAYPYVRLLSVSAADSENTVEQAAASTFTLVFAS